MDVVEAVLLFVGMALVGVRIIGLLSPLVAAVVTRTLPAWHWDDAMLLWTQLSAGVATFAIAQFALGGPWWAALIVAFLIAITTYTVRVPTGGEPLWIDADTRRRVDPARSTPVNNELPVYALGDRPLAKLVEAEEEVQRRRQGGT